MYFLNKDMVELLLFPNQLFEPTLLKEWVPGSIKKIHFIEEPLYYGKRKGSDAVKSLRLNQLRILYMYMAHKKYLDQLQKHFTVEYHSIDKPFSYKMFSKKECVYIDPADLLLEEKLQKIPHIQRLNSPSFMMTREDLAFYAEDRKGKHLQHSHFYSYVKKKLHILENVKNMDVYNRVPFSKNIPLPEDQYRNIYSQVKEWEEGVHWLVNSKFAKNPKPIAPWNVVISEYLTRLPLTSEHVQSWMRVFFQERFANYGKYQDVIIDTDPLLYHSGLSIYLNNGLITPKEVIETATKYKKDIASYEGFVRQIIGWREYTRYYYHYVPKEIYQENVFQNSIRKLPKVWYTGDIGIPLVDTTIVHAMNYGYINHIQRLMVISNYMTLANYHPDMIYKWMYEFSLDSYEWVMVFNCYSMGAWSDRGFAMRKPYISSSSYLLKMSSQKKGEWTETWDRLYHAFLQKNKQILKHTQLANLVA